jgi:hypothetical protein
MLLKIIFLNGLWDLYSSAAILLALPDLHTPRLRLSPLGRRLLAHWIFAYGIVRLSGSPLAQITYLQEGLFWIREGSTILGAVCFLFPLWYIYNYSQS